MGLTDELREYAASQGVDLVGCTSAAPFAGTRRWQESDPRNILPGAESVVVAACYMYTGEANTPSEPGVPRGRFGPWTVQGLATARYAGEVVREFFAERGFRVAGAESLPIKMAAVRSGAAKYGKNTIVHADGFGSYLKFGAVVTDAELDCRENPIQTSDCGDCEDCVKACPTGALDEPFVLNTDRCITAWFWGDPIPREDREKIGNLIFRCSFCQDACPMNKELKPRSGFPFEFEPKSSSPELIPLLLGDEDDYRRILPEFPMEAGIATVRRNAAIALGNSDDQAAVEPLIEVLCSGGPRIRAAAAWALGKLGGTTAASALSRTLPSEEDADVQEEIEAALRQ
jgi:epoxyqueuosine reductase